MRVPFRAVLAALLLNAVFASAETLTLQPSSGGTFRFKDLAGQAYGSAFTSAYSYASAGVQVALDGNGSLFLSGTIAATGLKPNFAYQIKLVGRPSKLYAADADDATNEQLGRLGGWWRYQPNPGNANDADYDANKNNPNYIYSGYLLIAFFVTDAQGQANIHFIGNNSYHVLWRTDQRPPAANDGPPLAVTLPPTAGNTAYDVALPARNATLYGEHEPTRALPGQLEMPLGHYRCNFVLTEESFHDSGPLAGSWADAMNALLDFDIPATTIPSEPQPNPIDVLQLHARLVLQRSGHDRAFVLGRLTLPEGVALKDLEVGVNVMGVPRSFVLDERGNAFSTDGRLLVRRDRQDKNSAMFLLSVRRGAFAVFGPAGASTASSTTAPPATPRVSVRLDLGAQAYSAAVEPTLQVGANYGKLTYIGKK